MDGWKVDGWMDVLGERQTHSSLDPWRAKGQTGGQIYLYMDGWIDVRRDIRMDT